MYQTRKFLFLFLFLSVSTLSMAEEGREREEDQASLASSHPVDSVPGIIPETIHKFLLGIIPRNSSSQSGRQNGKDGNFSMQEISESFGNMPKNNARKVKIFVKNGSIINKSTGSGATSISSSNQGIKVIVDGKHFESDDTRGPYVITTDANGDLFRRDWTPEDETELNQTIEANERWRQQFQQNMEQFQSNLQSNIQSQMNQMNSLMNNMFGRQNSMFGGGANSMFGGGANSMFGDNFPFGRRMNAMNGMNMFG